MNKYFYFKFFKNKKYYSFFNQYTNSLIIKIVKTMYIFYENKNLIFYFFEKEKINKINR